MAYDLIQLYPTGGKPVPIDGLYLQHQLHKSGKPVVYSNYVTSLDGRIAIASPNRQSHEVPRAIANRRDWGLYQELAAQADLLITSARYFRQTLAGEEQDRLPVGKEADFEHLLKWRHEQGLSAQPDIAILSSSLDIPVQALQPYQARRIFILTGDAAVRRRIRPLQEAGAEVVFAGEKTSVDGARMITQMTRLGYRSIYAMAGPQVLYTLIKAQVLNRLYLTITHQLLAGEEFDTLTFGPPLQPQAGLRLGSLYLDPHAPAGASQWLAMFECN